MALSSRSIGEYLDQLSSANPTPGGGSAAALAGSIAASLGRMVCAIASRKQETRELAALWEGFSPLSGQFLTLAEEDERAFTSVLAAYRLPKDDPDRAGRVQVALRQACEVPLRSATLARDLLALLALLAPLGTKSSVSDVGVGALLAYAALESALLNVDINLASLSDPAAKALLAAQRDGLRSEGKHLAERTQSLVRKRL